MIHVQKVLDWLKKFLDLTNNKNFCFPFQKVQNVVRRTTSLEGLQWDFRPFCQPFCLYLGLFHGIFGVWYPRKWTWPSDGPIPRHLFWPFGLFQFTGTHVWGLCRIKNLDFSLDTGLRNRRCRHVGLVFSQKILTNTAPWRFVLTSVYFSKL